MNRIQSSIRNLLHSNRFWFLFFIVWLIWISGILPDTFSQSNRGILQVLQLQSLVSEREHNIAAQLASIDEKEKRIIELNQDPHTQEREIRKTLGYARENELIFEIRR